MKLEKEDIRLITEALDEFKDDDSVEIDCAGKSYTMPSNRTLRLARLREAFVMASKGEIL